MSSLHRIALLALAGATASCTRQAPPPETARADSSPVAARAANDSALKLADESRLMGSPSAKVWLVMASDFQCPYCKAFHDQTFPKIIANYVTPGRVRVAFVNHPVPIHDHAVIAAEAAMCAGVQGRFWQMHDQLFATQDHWAALGDPVPAFDSLAAGLQVRMPDWRSCVAGHQTRPMVDGDYVRTTRAGVSGTPSFFVADSLVIVGAEDYPVFKDALDKALAKVAGAAGATKTP